MKDKKTAKTTIVLAVLFAVALYFIGSTYARYASEFDGTANVNVAKWNVGVTGADGNKFTLNLTPDTNSNTNVVANRIAPGVSAIGEVEVNLSETEVAVEIEASIDDEEIEDLGLTAGDLTTEITATAADGSNLTVEETDTNSGVFVVSLPTGGFTSTSKVNVNITVKWANEEHNDTDTTVGEKGDSLSIPVTLTVKQHI